MTCDLLTVQASMVASESAFSFSGRVLSKFWTTLTQVAVEVCICLKDYLDSVERIQHLALLEDPLTQNVELEIMDEEYAQGLSTPPEDEDDDDEDEDEDEEYVNALREIAKELGKKKWNFSLNPCGGDPSWNTNVTDTGSQFKNSVLCDCSYPGGVCHVVEIAVTANRLSGSIPTSLGEITSLVTVILENNMFFGTVPAELGKLTNLSVLVLSANNFSGKLPEELNLLTNLTELRISSNNFSGKIPNLGNCTKLQKLEIQDSGLEGQIPESLSFLRNITELRISDLSGEGSHFPNLSRMANMTKWMLRSCNIIGTIPGYISQMSNLSHLYLTGNSLEGSLPKWITDKDLVDLSYNNFSKDTVPQDCGESLNLFRSYSSGNNSKADLFYVSPDYYSVYINCGGPGVTIGNKTYEADEYLGGPANFFPSSDRWGFSNTGKIVFRDNQSYKSLGRRVFDVYVQGVTKLKNFDIKIAAGGVDKEKSGSNMLERVQQLSH
ncbi:probable leucine-rich repeat receptor-like serine/threonine-protein kinase At3g14840 [Lactuca sativa]|uniref:probable leucine-rich repeat receptor-like serine/threonine-protein kinase At3g14840 n=1 Tax=Lactuca sativa TaxID=4236 RepID=UPI0022AF31AC|nr:probable leucine-rich repeat receptor-like serine/threonine-protein kinase At3g14840 [Lactuca sativa]